MSPPSSLPPVSPTHRSPDGLAALRRQSLRWGGLALAILLVGLGLQGFATTSWLAPWLIVGALGLLSAVALRVMLSVRYTPAATGLLILGGMLLLGSQLLRISEAVPTMRSWPVVGSQGIGHTSALLICGWGGTAMMGASLYLSLMDAALNQAQLQAAHDELEARVEQRTLQLRDANEQLSADQQRFHYIAASAGEWLWELDAAGHYIWSSSAVSDLLGFTAAEILGRPYQAFLLGDADGLPAAGADGTFQRLECRRHRNGRERLLETTAAVVTSEDGTVTGFIGASRDVTTRAEIEEQLAAIRGLESLGQLAGGVAHDFNNLITAILNCADTLGHLMPDHQEAQSLLAVQRDAAAEASAVARSLLLLGPQDRADKEFIELRPLVQNSLRLLQRLLPTNIQLTSQVDDSDTDRLWVFAQPTALRQVLVNLVVNARDAMPDGGTITVGLGPAAEEPARVRLWVSDTGHGMTPEVRRRIFQPFFTTKPRGHGTGLGLAIVASIVQQHEGSISVESAPDCGTTLSISLPAHHPSRQPDPEPAGAGSDQAKPNRTRTVLLLEPQRVVRGYLAARLRAAGYPVVLAASEAELRTRLEELRDEVGLVIVAAEIVPGCLAKRFANFFAGLERFPVIVTADSKEPLPIDGNQQLFHIYYKPFPVEQLLNFALQLLASPTEPSSSDLTLDQAGGSTRTKSC